MRAGLKPSFSWAVYVMAVLLIVIFIGFLNHFRHMYYGPAQAAQCAAGRHGQRLVRGADVARSGAPAGAGLVVAGRHLELSDLDRARPCRRGCHDRPMIAATHRRRHRDRHDRAGRAAGGGRRTDRGGGRMQMAYAWYRSPGRRSNCAISAAAASVKIFRCGAARRAGRCPSVAAISPLLGWYEREITDLFGVEFAGHPEPHRLVLHPGAHPVVPPFDPDYPADTILPFAPAKGGLPEVAGADVQRLPFGPVRADVVEFGAASLLLCRRAHPAFSSRSCSSSIAAWRSASRGVRLPNAVVLAERVSGVGSFAHALAFCQAVEQAAGCEVPSRARLLALAAGRARAALQPSALSWASGRHDHA